MVLYANRNYAQLVGKVYEDDSYYKNYQDTADMWGEFLPVSANLNVISKCKKEGCEFKKVMVPEDVNKEVINERSNILNFKYQSQKDFLAIVNTYYFSGWKSYLDNSPYGQISVNEVGTMDIKLPKRNHDLELRFENNNIRNIFLMVSLLGLIGFAVYIKCLKK